MKRTKLLLVLSLLASSVRGQNINRTTDTDEDSSFKPPFPIECRMIDYATWQTTAVGGLPASIRCQELYGDLVNQPGAFSAESQKICMESFADYGAVHTVPGLSIDLFCNVAELNILAKKVVMHQYLKSKLATVAVVTDHDLYRNFQRWVDETNLRLLDQWESGLYSGAAAQKLSQECLQALGGYWCSKVFPNCTYMLKARWPYNELEEKIYTCKETCEEVLEFCPIGWLPYPVRCDDYQTNAIDAAAIGAIAGLNEREQAACDARDPNRQSSCEGLIENNAYNRRDFGGHACASTKLTKIWVDAVTEEEPSCFPAEATVSTPQGKKLMSELKVGDCVLSKHADGSVDTCDEVYMFGHAEHGSSHLYHKISLGSGSSIHLSNKHFIHSAESSSTQFKHAVLKYAEDVFVGDWIWGADGAASQVRAVERVVLKGAFNPYTTSGNIIVDNVVASAHSEWFLDNTVPQSMTRFLPHFYQSILSVNRALHTAFGPAAAEALGLSNTGGGTAGDFWISSWPVVAASLAAIVVVAASSARKMML